jgi:hypothetical protein
MVSTINFLNKVGVHGVKFHHLQVVKGTALERMYQQGKVKLLGEQEYVELVSHLLEHLRPGVVVHRLVGEVLDERLVAPRWKFTKRQLIERIVRYMSQRGMRQGRRFGEAAR